MTGAVALFSNESTASDYSAMLTGPLGLNIIPNARMYDTGTITIGTSTMDPYLHGYIGFQIAAPLYINIRQSAETSNINNDPDRLYPGIDLKLRLLKETKTKPEVALGLQSAIGHKRMAGEYLALSKRYEDFDFTAGIGWGRYGSAGHFNNPLKALHSHFGKARDTDGEMPNEPNDWFTGNKAGFFAGMEYFTPVKGLSAKLDWGADRYSAETNTFNYNKPAPWSIGLSYSPENWANIAIAIQGSDKIMGRLSLKSILSKWKNQYKREETKPLRPYRTELALPARMALSARHDGILLYDTDITAIHETYGKLVIPSHTNTPSHIGRAAIHMANHGGPSVEKLTLQPTIMGLRGPHISIMRKDLERAIAMKQGSPQEIWHNTEINTPNNDQNNSFKKLNRNAEVYFGLQDIHFSLDTQLSLAEEDSGALYRTAFLAKTKGPRLFGLLDSGASTRINIKDNLHRITDLRPRALLPVRSDIDLFAARTVALDHSYLAFTHSFRNDLHLALIGGYLEEMYAGLGGEILYRLFKSRFAIGAELWQAFKRDPLTNMNMGLNGDHILSGHLNLWYDVPTHNITLQAKAGRYLVEDIGASLSVIKQFNNGARLEGFVSISDQADFDLFGGTTHSHHGVRLSLPLGGFKSIPVRADIRTKIEPFGRDIGQSIENPLPLYDLTRPFSYPHITAHWNDITP